MYIQKKGNQKSCNDKNLRNAASFLLTAIGLSSIVCISLIIYQLYQLSEITKISEQYTNAETTVLKDSYIWNILIIMLLYMAFIMLAASVYYILNYCSKQDRNIEKINKNDME